MKLNNKNLHQYIQKNAPLKIQNRANEVVVGTLEFSEDGDSVTVDVVGSNGTRYEVRFQELKTDKISSKCTCPYNFGPVCKHQVAVAQEIDELIGVAPLTSLKDSDEKSEEPLGKKYNKDQSIIIPLPELNTTFNEYVSPLTTVRVLREFQYNYEFEVIEIGSHDLSIKKFTLEVVSQYHRRKEYKQIIEKDGENLNIHCNCNATNKYLCIHQLLALDYINDNYQPFLWSEQEINEAKSVALQEYGYNLDDPSHTSHFNFVFHEGKVIAQPKKEGVLKLRKYQSGINELVDRLIDGDEATKDALPNIGIKRPAKMAVAMGIAHIQDAGNAVYCRLVPLRGKLKKNGDFYNSIYKITPEDFYQDKTIYTQGEVALIDPLLALPQDNYPYKGDKQDACINAIIDTLKKINIDFSEQLVYEIENGNNVRVAHQNKLSARDLKKVETLDVENHPVLHFTTTKEKDFIKLQAWVTVGEESFKLNDRNLKIVQPFLIKDNIYHLFKNLNEAKAFHSFSRNPLLRIPKAEFSEYYKDLIQPLAQKYMVSIKHLPTKTVVIDEANLVSQLYLSEIHGFILIKPVVQYNDQHVNPLNAAAVQKLSDKQVEVLKRNENYEQDFVKLIESLHPEFTNPNQEFFHLSPEQFIENMWFLEAFEILKENNVQVFGYEGLSIKKYSLHKPAISVQVNSGIDWFDAKIEVSFGNFNVSLKDLQKAIINKSQYIQLGDGTIGILPEEWLKKYAHLFRAGAVGKNAVRVSKYQFSVIDSLYDHLELDDPLVKKHKEIKSRLEQFDKIETIAKPRGVKAKLRDYQKEGINWLGFLDEFNFGGCLADDMGLGKTLQIITFLKHINTVSDVKSAHLVVVPTSLIFNWQEEIKKFCPSLKVVVQTGINRKKDTKAFKPKHIVLTTYGTAMRDIEFLKEYEFHYIVLDESQAIKNPNSQRYKAMRLFRAKNRLVMTGTPIENNTFDLYAQMSFINPGLLGSMFHFKKSYSDPIDKHKNQAIVAELRQLINPFLLRRTKEQVATELPEKTEQVLYCSMSESQQAVYDAYRNKYRNYVLGKIKDEGLGKSKMYVLEGLMKLRQICDAPQLLNDKDHFTDESIKIKELVRHITEKTGEHKILVFSQFVRMLQLVKKELDKHKIEYEYLDGKTKDRQEKVNHFQENNEVRVFLISLKAGGTGLNLTAADYVYIVDPWWNPAVEAQAIDRCYRIGQKKHVMAYKMICKNTIEEKIVSYQETKKQLSDDIIQTDDSFVKSLSKESIIDLFS